MHATRRKVVDRKDALELLSEFDASGLELGVFCAERAIDGRSLQCWQRNLRQAAPDRTAEVRLVELTTPSKAAAPAMYRVVVGEFAVEVDDAFRDDTLARLLGVVTRC